MAVAWQGLSMTDQLAVMATVHAAGAVVMVSAGGSTEAPFATITGSNYGLAVYICVCVIHILCSRYTVAIIIYLNG